MASYYINILVDISTKGAFMNSEYRKITKIARVCELYSQQQLKDLLVNYSELQLLHYIRHHEGCSQEEARNYICCDKSLITRYTNHLLKEGLVIRKQSTIDLRKNELYSTLKAQSYKEQLTNCESRYYDYLFKDIDSVELNCFLKVLDKIYIKSKIERASCRERV